jgi:hypothetical protein
LQQISNRMVFQDFEIFPLNLVSMLFFKNVQSTLLHVPDSKNKIKNLKHFLYFRNYLIQVTLYSIKVIQSVSIPEKFCFISEEFFIATFYISYIVCLWSNKYKIFVILKNFIKVRLFYKKKFKFLKNLLPVNNTNNGIKLIVNDLKNLTISQIFSRAEEIFFHLNNTTERLLFKTKVFFGHNPVD